MREDCGYVADSRPAWLRWWHRKTIRSGMHEGHFILRTSVHLSWQDWALMLFGRPLVIEYRSEHEPSHDEQTHKMLDSMQCHAWTQPRKWR